MGSIRRVAVVVGSALVAIVVASVARPVTANPVASPAPSPSGSPAAAPFRHPNFAALAARDPGLVVDFRASTSSGLRSYRTVRQPFVAGFLEPSEGVAGRCGGSSYAAVPLDSGTAAGIAGWLLFRPGVRRHVAVVAATEGLDFRRGRLVATNFVYSPRSAANVHRIDSIACTPAGLVPIGSRVVTQP